MSNGPSVATNASLFMQEMNIEFGNSKNVTVFGIIIIPGDTSCYKSQDTTVYYGNLIADTALKTGGVLGSICDNDYSKNLQNIGQRVTQSMNQVSLSKPPISGSVSVTFTPQMQISWSLQGQKIIFASPVPDGTRIDVSYDEQ